MHQQALQPLLQAGTGHSQHSMCTKFNGRFWQFFSTLLVQADSVCPLLLQSNSGSKVSLRVCCAVLSIGTLSSNPALVMVLLQRLLLRMRIWRRTMQQKRKMRMTTRMRSPLPRRQRALPSQQQRGLPARQLGARRAVRLPKVRTKTPNTSCNTMSCVSNHVTCNRG